MNVGDSHVLVLRFGLPRYVCLLRYESIAACLYRLVFIHTCQFSPLPNKWVFPYMWYVCIYVCM